MNLDDTFRFKLGFTKKKDERGRLCYRKFYANGGCAIVSAVGDDPEPTDRSFHVEYRHEGLNLFYERDCQSPIAGEFFLSNILEMTKNKKA